MVKKKCLILWLILFTLLIFFSPASAQVDDHLWEEQKQSVDLKLVEKYWQEITAEVDEYLPEMEFEDIFKLLWGRDGGKLDIKGIFKGLSLYLIREVTANLSLMGRLVILAVIAALLKNLQTAFTSRRLSSLSQSLVFIVLLSLAMQSFSLASSIGKNAIDRMVDFTLAL
ncbi:MAG: hypothetical protein CVU88_07955, partial [Firmicutes bacterium HGW-Firmicutes-13]